MPTAIVVRRARVRAVGAVAGQPGRQYLARRRRDVRSAVETDDLAAVDGQVERLAIADVVERRDRRVELEEVGRRDGGAWNREGKRERRRGSSARGTRRRRVTGGSTALFVPAAFAEIGGAY
jgi:hypothetical protein